MSSYPAPPFDALSFLGMVAMVVAVVPAAAWVFSAGKPAAQRAWLAAMLATMALSAGLAAAGWLAQVGIRPPLLQSLIVLLLLLLLWRGFSARGRRAARAMSLPALVLLQSFRLPLEVLMLHAAHAAVMPVEFSMAGYNFDGLSGALALLLGLALLRAARRGGHLSLAWVWAWNLWGMACLCVIVVLAVLTSPNVAFFGEETAHVSVWVLRFPYVWLPTVLVGVAIYGHLALSLHLLARSAAKSNTAVRAQGNSSLSIQP